MEVKEHDPDLIAQVMEIDLLTFSDPTWSRYTAGLMLRHGRTFLLKVDNALVGTCQCLRSWEIQDEASLFSMTIRPGWRGQGLGRLFLEEVINALANSGIQSVVIEVDPDNPVVMRLYKSKLGFEYVRDCVNEYGKGHRRIHLRRMIAPVVANNELSFEDIKPAAITDGEALIRN